MSSTSDLRSISDLHLRPPYWENWEAFTKKYIPLYKVALTGDWEAAQDVIRGDPDVVRASITEGGETALHIAAAGKNQDFVQKLISEMLDDDLEKQNKAGNTALCFAAAEGNLQIVKLMIARRQNLSTTVGPNGVKPIYMAASLGHNDIVKSLYSEDFKDWNREERANILTACTASGLFDVARTMITDDNPLLTTPDDNTETTLDVLVRMSSEFTNDNKKLTCFGSAKELLKYILELVLYPDPDPDPDPDSDLDVENKIDISSLMPEFPRLVMMAAVLGNIEFLVIFLQHFPDLIWTTDTLHRSIFHHAVSIRHRGIFNLIYEVNSIRCFLTNKRDEDNNNMLHLVANLAPQNELDKVSGAALQMQSELLWFKEVSKIVPPSYRNMKNTEGQTPADIFTKKHEKLMEKGEKWMKDTATSSMLVATIIASVVFTTIFTVPGGIDNKTGVPILSHKPIMKVFYMSMAMALFLSSTSILMFLSILTSRYAEKDFLHSLPLKLMLGVTTLILSLGAMVLSFCTAIFLSYNGRFSLFHILLGVLFSLVPILCFLLKFYLLRDVICSVYNARNMFGPQNRLFSQKR